MNSPSTSSTLDSTSEFRDMVHVVLRDISQTDLQPGGPQVDFPVLEKYIENQLTESSRTYVSNLTNKYSTWYAGCWKAFGESVSKETDENSQ